MERTRTYPPTSSRFLKDRRGASVLEMTVMMPFLLFLAFGVIEFGRALYHYHAINKSVRDAARFMARVRLSCDPPPSTTCTPVDATDEARAKNLALTGQISGGTPILGYWTDPTTITIQYQPYDNSAGDYYIPNTAVANQTGNFPRIRVTAVVPFQDLGMLGVLGLSSITMRVRHDQLGIGE